MAKGPKGLGDDVGSYEVEPTAEEAEFDSTPAWAVHRLLEQLDALHVGIRSRCGVGTTRLVDPCVGEGAIIEAVRGYCSAQWPAVPAKHSGFPICLTWDAWDVRRTAYLQAHQASRGDVRCRHANYLTPTRKSKADFCLMNPPFSRALQFVAEARRHCRLVAMLQRLNWMQGPAERMAYLADNPPAVFVLRERARFRPGKGTDSGGYAWYVWGDLEPRVRWCNRTPLEEIKACLREEVDPRQGQLFGGLS